MRCRDCRLSSWCPLVVAGVGSLLMATNSGVLGLTELSSFDMQSIVAGDLARTMLYFGQTTVNRPRKSYSAWQTQ